MIDFLALCHDGELRKQHATLKAYIEKTQPHGLNDLEVFIQNTDQALFDQCQRLAFTMYKVMSESDKWGDAGDQQVKLSFCRKILDIPAAISISYEHVTLFYAEVTEQLKVLGLDTLSLEEAKNELETMAFVLEGYRWPIPQLEDLMVVLRFLGSKYLLQGGFYGYDIELILGKGTCSTQGDYDIVYLEEEAIRTPNTIMSMAAVIGHKTIYVRKEALESIFYQKWMGFLENSDQDTPNDFFRISSFIKKQTLQAYGVSTLEELQKIAPLFIQDMQETVLYHELGHGVIQHQLLKKSVATLGEASKVCGETIVSALLEFLADFAPVQNDIMGPIANMIRIAKTDSNRAFRMYLMYLSDTWFFDTPDIYMYLYSDLVSMIMVTYFEPSKGVDFEKLDQDITHLFLPFMLDRVSALCDEIDALTKQAIYMVDGQSMSYETLIQKIKIKIDSDLPLHTPLDDYSFLTTQQADILDHLQKHSDSAEALKEILKKSQEKIVKDWMILVLGEAKAARFHYDPRAYFGDAF